MDSVKAGTPPLPARPQAHHEGVDDDSPPVRARDRSGSDADVQYSDIKHKYFARLNLGGGGRVPFTNTQSLRAAPFAPQPTSSSPGSDIPVPSSYSGSIAAPTKTTVPVLPLLQISTHSPPIDIPAGNSPRTAAKAIATAIPAAKPQLPASLPGSPPLHTPPKYDFSAAFLEEDEGHRRISKRSEYEDFDATIDPLAMSIRDPVGAPYPFQMMLPTVAAASGFNADGTRSGRTHSAPSRTDSHVLLPPPELEDQFDFEDDGEFFESTPVSSKTATRFEDYFHDNRY